MKPRLLIFDLDGTLINSAPDIADAMNVVMQNHSRQAVSLEQVRGAMGDGVRRLVAKLYPAQAGTAPNLDAITAEFYAIYEQNLLNKTKINEGVLEFLQDFLARNRAQMAIVSNKPESLTRKIVSGSALQNFPWLGVFGGDSFPERKPHPMPLLKCIEMANLRDPEVTNANTVLVGDGKPDVESAHRAEVCVIALSTGYTAPAELLARKPQRLISSFTDLQAALDSL